MASSEEQPMEVDGNDKLPLPKPSDIAASNEDVTELRVSLSWPGDIEVKKFKSVITKTLQSWANKNSIKGEFTATDISEDGKMAVIQVVPASALKELLNLTGKQLTTKEKTTFSITPITPEEQTPDIKQSSGGYSSFTQQKARTDSAEFSDFPAHDDADKPCLVALGPYWYMKNFYPAEIRRIESSYDVKISENVAVTINSNKTANQKKASDEFTKLVQSCLNESCALSIPLKNVASEDWMETLKFLKTTDGKCQITVSSDEITIFGPQQYKVAISKSLQSGKISTNFPEQGGRDRYDTKLSLNVTDEERMNGRLRRESIRKEANTYEKDRVSPNRINMTSSIRDPFVIDGLPVEDYTWEIITNLHKKEVDRIQEKFNVRFKDSDTSRGKRIVKVRYNKSERNMPMESHGIRALLRLYQKVALSQSRHTNGSLDVDNVDLYSAYGEPNGATGQISKDDDKNKREADKLANKKPRGTEAKKKIKEEETCPVCMDSFTKKTKLKNCKHEFCEECLESSVKHLGAVCPVCKDVFGLVEGNQPDGTMRFHKYPTSLPGFNHCGTIEINYSIPGGKQTHKHPNPGQWYHGTSRTAYLPDNKEGNEVLTLLRKAFDQKLIFTVGMSRTTGEQNTVTWNDIHHKTSKYDGPFGYPDPDYLSRVKDELKAKGIK